MAVTTSVAAKLARFSWLPGGLAAALVIAVGQWMYSSTSLPLEDGNKDLGQEMDVVVTKYFKQGLLPAALSQSIDEPSALVRLRGGVFKPGDAYGKQVDSYMHRAFIDVIWRF